MEPGLNEDDVLRKLAAILLAMPVLAAVYGKALLLRSLVARIAVGCVIAGVAAILLVSGSPARQGAAAPTSAPPTPVAASLLDTVLTNHPLVAPIHVHFDKAMDPASVAEAVRIAPDAPVSFTWSADGCTLTITPLDAWQADTLYTVTVSTAAVAQDGGPLTAPLRALIMTMQPGSAAITATRMTGAFARPDTSFLVQLNKEADPAAVLAAFRLEPAVEVEIEPGPEADSFLLVPVDGLAPSTEYTASLTGLADAQGIAFDPVAPLVVRTGEAPDVVRYRPRDGQKLIDPAVDLSVRFTQPMNRAQTGAAFSVTAGGKPVTGTMRWAENSTVLVFSPKAKLPYSVKVVMTVADTAMSKAGVPIAGSSTGTFTTAPKPAPATGGGSTVPIGHSGGGGAVAGTWASVELYYLKLMNCTRTGGWVTSKGACSSPGGRNVAPLVRSTQISSLVSRPYAKLLATRGICNHFIGGTPGDRLRRQGFTSYRWAENLGCRSGNPYSAVLGSHLYFQREKPYNGGHYRNLMNAEYDRAGIGVWVAHGNVRLVVDFYHP